MDAAVEIRNVHKTFPNGARALQGVSLSVRQGEIFGILGPNGAGKTTLLNCISTLLVPDQGEITILGESVRHSHASIRRRMNLCSGNANFPWSLTLRENLRFYAMLYGLRGASRERKIDELLVDFSLESYADRRFDEVSTGTKQRLALAKSMINDPELLLLDEPTVGMDPDISLRVRRHIAEYHKRTGCTLLLTTHYMPEAQMLSERIVFIRDGQVKAEGTPAELQTNLKADDMEGVFLELVK
jgi:ABC-2 type transport system ATP-binding protein